MELLKPPEGRRPGRKGESFGELLGSAAGSLFSCILTNLLLWLLFAFVAITKYNRVGQLVNKRNAFQQVLEVGKLKIRVTAECEVRASFLFDG